MGIHNHYLKLRVIEINVNTNGKNLLWHHKSALLELPQPQSMINRVPCVPGVPTCPCAFCACVPTCLFSTCFFFGVPCSWGALFLACLIFRVPRFSFTFFLRVSFLRVFFRHALFSTCPVFGVPYFWRALFFCVPYFWRALFLTCPF